MASKGRVAVKKEPTSELVRSALRTLATETAGLEALSGVLNDGLGAAFVEAVEKIKAPRAA